MNDLKEWAIHHIKQKDMVKRDLVSIKEEDGKLICDLKEGIAVYYYADNLNFEKMKSVTDNDVTYFVCECNEHNFKLLVTNWDLFKTKPNLTLIFLNPKLSEKWIIKPYIHARIADPATLKQGLRTMYDTCMGNES